MQKLPNKRNHFVLKERKNIKKKKMFHMGSNRKSLESTKHLFDVEIDRTY